MVDRYAQALTYSPGGGSLRHWFRPPVEPEKPRAARKGLLHYQAEKTLDHHGWERRSTIEEAKMSGTTFRAG
jgi:hypothetical protein